MLRFIDVLAVAAGWLADPSEKLAGLTSQTHQPVIPGEQVAGLVLEDLLESCDVLRHDSSISLKVSVRPATTARPSTGSRVFSIKPCLSASKQPRRLPLSTVEM